MVAGESKQSLLQSGLVLASTFLLVRAAARKSKTLLCPCTIQTAAAVTPEKEEKAIGLLVKQRWAYRQQKRYAEADTIMQKVAI
jgi:hypothetical protein